MESNEEWWLKKGVDAVPSNWTERNKIESTIDLNLPDTLTDRSVGCILSVMIGDILGTPTEGHPRQMMLFKRNINGLTWNCFMPGKHMGLYNLPNRWGMYTDDTNSTLALASSLVDNQGLWPLHAAHQYGRFWISEPIRGYPNTAQSVMKGVLSGTDIYKTGTMCFENGSFANGGIMRIAPIGISFRNATVDELYEAVKMAIISSHVHPESIDASFIQAYAISILLKKTSQEITPNEFLDMTIAVSRNEDIKKKLLQVKNFFEIQPRPNENEILEVIGSDFQIRSSEAIACAFWGFITHWNEPEQCLIDLVGYGGDTDTICSIGAALCGALYGTKWIPRRWYDNCENGSRGRDYAVKLAIELCKLDLHHILTDIPQEKIDQLLQDSLNLISKFNNK